MQIKNLILTAAIFTVSIVLYSCSTQDFSTGKNPSKFKIFKTDPGINSLGKYAPSAGEMRTLIIYAMFSDDSLVTSNSWKYDTERMPEWTGKMLNNSKLIDFPDNNLTQYFYEMSNGSFLLYGDIYPSLVVPEYNQENYKSIGEVNYEILKKMDEEIDFSKYDNWSKTKGNEYVNRPDGKVDLIIIVYRNFENKLFFNKGWTGAAYMYLTKDILTNDGVKIAKGRLDSGSGIQSRGGRHGFQYLKYVLAHEFGHFLFGGGHIENVTSLALMTGGPVWNASRGMHSWEKEKLGWIKFKEITVGKNISFTINDYLSTGDAYRLKLSDKEWFIFENHQGISPNDKARDKGIYIYHVNNARRFAPSIEVECADGKWEFEIDSQKKKLIKTIPSRNGRTEMNFRGGKDNKSYACYEEVYEDNSAWGDEHDAFDTKYNNLFSPVSIPSSENKEKINFAVRIKDRIDYSYEVEVLFNEIYKNAPPSKPQIIGPSTRDKNMVIKWLPNLEPDLKAYKVYYSDFKKKNFRLYETIDAGTQKQQSDISFLLGNKKSIILIAVKAVDKDEKQSVFSDFLKLSYNPSVKNWESERIEQY